MIRSAPKLLHVQCTGSIRKFALRSTEEEGDMPTENGSRTAFTVEWEVRDGSADAAADIIARFLPEARKEPGVELLMINRSTANPSHFLFYEVFRDAAAFEAHQQTPHFRQMILEEALPLLSRRERMQYVPL
jgi:quinol monooxygenase YgiN